MNKRGIIGNLFLAIILIVVIVIGVIGISVYQILSLIATVNVEKPLIDDAFIELAKGDCSKVTEMEVRIDRVKTKAESACRNPFIRAGVDKAEKLPFNCDELTNIEEQLSAGFSQMKVLCANAESLSEMPNSDELSNLSGLDNSSA